MIEDEEANAPEVDRDVPPLPAPLPLPPDVSMFDEVTQSLDPVSGPEITLEMASEADPNEPEAPPDGLHQAVSDEAAWSESDEDQEPAEEPAPEPILPSTEGYRRARARITLKIPDDDIPPSAPPPSVDVLDEEPPLSRPTAPKAIVQAMRIIAVGEPAPSPRVPVEPAQEEPASDTEPEILTAASILSETDVEEGETPAVPWPVTQAQPQTGWTPPPPTTPREAIEAQEKARAKALAHGSWTVPRRAPEPSSLDNLAQQDQEELESSSLTPPMPDFAPPLMPRPTSPSIPADQIPAPPAQFLASLGEEEVELNDEDVAPDSVEPLGAEEHEPDTEPSQQKKIAESLASEEELSDRPTPEPPIVVTPVLEDLEDEGVDVDQTLGEEPAAPLAPAAPLEPVPEVVLPIIPIKPPPPPSVRAISLPPTPAPTPVQPRISAPPEPPPTARTPQPKPASSLAPSPEEISKLRRRVRPPWEEVFSDDFVRTYPRLTSSQVDLEVNFVEDSLGVQKGGVMLDLGCGMGQHAVELASRGYNVVGYDLSLTMLAQAADEAQERSQKINFLQGDMREMAFEEMFDGVYCWGTSFGFFDEESNVSVIRRVHRALRQGGMFLLDLVNRDYVCPRLPSLAWFEGDGCVCIDDAQLDSINSRLRVKRTIMLEDGHSREVEYSLRLYSLHEIGRILHDAGFRVVEVSGHPATAGAFFGAESPRIIALAERR